LRFHLSFFYSFPTRRSSDLRPFSKSHSELVLFQSPKHGAITWVYPLVHETPRYRYSILIYPLQSFSDNIPALASTNLHNTHIRRDRKSTRLNSSHVSISYAV